MERAGTTATARAQFMAGFDAPYVPGWDCHGLPIEIKVDKELGGKKLQMAPSSVRTACRKYAQKYLDLQRAQFKRIGVFGRFERPYATMTPQYESVVLSTFFSFYENGFVYKGLRAVYWCMTGIALSLILGGAVGNLWDRVASGRVIDFLDVYYKQYHWPVFNLADSCIVIGASLLVVEIVFGRPKPAESS